MLSVSCENPAGVTGTIESAVDVRDPAWKPGQYDQRNGRKVRTTQRRWPVTCSPSRPTNA